MKIYVDLLIFSYDKILNFFVNFKHCFKLK
jgi:hypothetical protein